MKGYYFDRKHHMNVYPIGDPDKFKFYEKLWYIFM